MKNINLIEKIVFFTLILFLISELFWLGYTNFQEKKQKLIEKNRELTNKKQENKEIKINDLITTTDRFQEKLNSASEFNNVVLNYLEDTRKLNHINFFEASYLVNIYHGRVVEVKKGLEVKIKDPIDGYQPIFQIIFQPIEGDFKEKKFSIYMNQDEYELARVELIKPGGIVEDKSLNDIRPNQLIKVIEKFDLKDDNRLTSYQISIIQEDNAKKGN